MHVLSSCQPGLLLMTIRANQPVPLSQGASLNCYNFQKRKLFLYLKFKSAADTGTEHHISAQLVANGRWEESSLTLWLQFRPCLLSSPPDQSLPSAFPPKSLVCRLLQARMGMDQCLRAPPAELISIASSRPPPPPPSSTPPPPSQSASRS